MKKSLQHFLNARHIYCRLRNLGLSMKKAKKYAITYERFIYKFIYS